MPWHRKISSDVRPVSAPRWAPEALVMAKSCASSDSSDWLSASWAMPSSVTTVLRCLSALSFGRPPTTPSVMSPASMLPRRSSALSSVSFESRRVLRSLNRVCTNESLSRPPIVAIDFIAAPVRLVLLERSSSISPGNEAAIVSTAASVIPLLVTASTFSAASPFSRCTSASSNSRQLKICSFCRPSRRPKRAMSSAVTLEPSCTEISVSTPDGSTTQVAPAPSASIRLRAACTSAGLAARATGASRPHVASRPHIAIRW